jgi:hypothetical protein
LAAAPRRGAAVAFIFVTILLDMLAVGVIIPILPRLVESFVDNDSDRRSSVPCRPTPTLPRKRERGFRCDAWRTAETNRWRRIRITYKLRLAARTGCRLLPLPLAGEGWGGGGQTRRIRPAAIRYFFTSGHSLASSGFAASSGEIVATSL